MNCHQRTLSQASWMLPRRTILLVLPLLLSMISLSASSTRIIKVRKLCKDSDIQVMANKGVKIEPYERSRVELKLGETLPGLRKNRFTMTFDFKTNSSNGTLFLGRSSEHPKETIGLVLRGGQLIYKIQCPSLHADILLRTRRRKPVNDNRWHSIFYTNRNGKHGRKGRIAIDGYSHTKLYDVNCAQITSLVMGGKDPSHGKNQYYDYVEAHGHYEGCIRNLNVSMFLTAPPKYYAVSECDD